MFSVANVDVHTICQVTGLMTQGRGDGQSWVTSYMVSYSLDAFDWDYVSDIYGNQRVSNPDYLWIS